MARLGRIVAAGFPHHRGNPRPTIFFEPADHALYRDLLAKRCRRASVEVWACCLMPNHVHLVLTPSTPDGLSRAIAETHRQYTGFINARARWIGHLFQGRFSSVAPDDAHLMAAARYVPHNPVRARLVARAQDWAWSSARARLAGRDDALVRVAPLLDRIGRFCDLIDSDHDRDFRGLARRRNQRLDAGIERVHRYAGAHDRTPFATAKAGTQAGSASICYVGIKTRERRRSLDVANQCDAVRRIAAWKEQ